MSGKSLVMIGMFVGSIIGGYIPVLFGASLLSFASLIGNTIGAVAGIFIAYKLVNY